MKFEFDFSVYDQRVAANLLMHLQEREHGEFRHASFTRCAFTSDVRPPPATTLKISEIHTLTLVINPLFFRKPPTHNNSS